MTKASKSQLMEGGTERGLLMFFILLSISLVFPNPYLKPFLVLALSSSYGAGYILALWPR